jgi:MarR family transcriptional regulator, 2-MHQ and catechol-resistance regulon repressor
MMQQLTTQATNAKQSWARLVRAYAAIARELNARLSAEHDLTKNEYEVLLLLARAEEFRLRRIDIATELILSPSGITRMLDRLETSGLVEKAECASDRRVSYAVLTDDGMTRLKAAGRSHDAVIEELVGARLAEPELKTLTEILERLPSVEGEGECTVGDE